MPGELFYPASTNPFAQANTERDSLFTFLESIDQETFTRAFSRLSDRSYTRYTRTEQFDEEDYLIAFEERVLRHGEGKVDLVEHDSAGTFDYGYFSRFVSETGDTYDPTDLARHIVPDDPAYMSARNREAYVYRSLSDTLMWDMVARVIEVRARPEEGDGQNIRRVRLYIERGSNKLIAMYVERIDLALWFREESRFYVHVRPTSAGEWVPYNTRFETLIRVPFRSAQRFRTVSTYFSFAERS
ncbi:MAG: hypothetical protein WD275_00290 [Rhodothermales bacterium]